MAYNSEAMASDIADATSETFTTVVISETFRKGDGHAFNVEFTGELKFLVTVTKVENS